MAKKTVWIFAGALLLLALPALGAQAEPAAAPGTGLRSGAIGAAFLLGVAAAFGALAQGRATAAAAEAMSRNPGAAGPIRLMTIIGLGLIESLVLYALLIASQIRNL